MSEPPRLSFPKSFENSVKQALQTETALKEFDLMKHLVKDGFAAFTMSLNELEMFRSHFLLFHLLYQLQDKWHLEHLGWLEIHTLKIALTPYQTLPNPSSPKPHLPAGDTALKDYYLNLDNLTNTTQEEVLTLLESFWQRFSRTHSNAQISDDLAVLQLSELAQQFSPLLPENIPPLLHLIKQQRKQLFQKHHPDKGGSRRNFATIQQASERIIAHLNHQR